MYGSQWGSLAAVRILYYKSHENPYQVLQVTCTVSARAMKSKVHTYDKIIITIVLRKNITRLFPLTLLLMLYTHNNTDGNKLVIFLGIAWYYGDTYIVSWSHAPLLSNT